MMYRLVEIAIANAFRDVGVREVGGNNRGSRVEQYQRNAGGMPGDAWCYAALYTWFLDASRALLLPCPLPKTMGVHKAFRKLTIADGVRVMAAPTRGCIAFHDSGKGLGHVGLVVDTRIPEGSCVTLEGNTDGKGSREGDSVAEKRRPLDYWNLGVLDIRPFERVIT